MEMSFDIVLRLLFAFVLGALVGVERDIHGRAAGIRTNMLVCVGSALFTLASLVPENGDKGRIAAQIVSGIGFLGAGTIIKSGFNIRGLTTAACMWLVAAIGMICGMGSLVLATGVTVVMLLVLMLAKAFENRIHRIYTLRMIIDTGDQDFPAHLNTMLAESPKYSVSNVDVSREPDEIWHYDIVLDVNSGSGPVQTDMELLGLVGRHVKDVRRVRVTGQS